MLYDHLKKFLTNFVPVPWLYAESLIVCVMFNKHRSIVSSDRIFGTFYVRIIPIPRLLQSSITDYYQEL